MKSIEITEAFTGYPDGKTKRRFTVGETPTDLPDDYADLLVEKGHAKPSTAKPQIAPPPAAEPAVEAKTETKA